MNANKNIPEATEELLIATFQLGNCDGIFGIDATSIQEVVMVGDLTPVHHALEYVVGIRNLRGRIITVIDLCARLGLGHAAVDRESRILIAGWKGESIGLLVGKVAEAIAVEVNDLETAPPNLHGVQMQKLVGIFRSGHRLGALLDLSTVLCIDDRTGNAISIEEKRA